MDLDLNWLPQVAKNFSRRIKDRERPASLSVGAIFPLTGGSPPSHEPVHVENYTGKTPPQFFSLIDSYIICLP